MIVPIDQTLENLKAIIDKYEYPELFTFLDYYQAQYEQYQKKILNPFQKNSFVLDSRPAGPETGIVTEINKDEMKVNFYNRIEIFSNENNRLSRGSGKTLPLDWARKGAWGKFGRFRLKTLSHYLYLAHHFDKMQSLSNSRTQILGHQIESTYKVVSSINPRFLIADEVGLGKTVEAGLIMKEFIIRHNYHRVLIIVPASLQFQWQQEMKEKFNEEFWIIDSRSLSKLKKKLPGKVILSLDFAKQDKIKKLLLKEKWDTLIFDEAHRLRRDAVTKTLAYTLAETLCGKVNVLLLLSATPFSGKLEELYYLVRLLNPALLGSIRSFTNNYASGRKQDIHEKLESVLIRRRKVGVGGFTKRFAKTVSFEFTDEEQELYDRTTDYIRNEYNKALQTKNSLQSFILIVYQKMLDSSSYALIRTIASRVEYLTNLLSLEKEALNKVLESKKTFMRKFRQLEINGEHDSDESGETEELLKKYTEKEAADLRRELAALKEIHALALKIRINKKGETLKQVIREIMRTEKSPKILIFTQFARTQEYLAELLSEYRVSIFSGRLDKRAKDKAIVDFKNFSNILISTEAGGEGRNLQFCHYLINYDLPWNPQKIEQRIGRLHRFGQKNDVRIYNFSTKGTIGARILDVLETKIKIFEDSIGATDTLLGYYEDEIDFNDAFMKFHVDPDKVQDELESKMEKTRRHYSYLEKLTAHRVVDFNLDAFYDTTKKERLVNNALIQEMVEEYARLEDSDLLIRKGKGISAPVILQKGNTGSYTGFFDSKTAIEHPEKDFFAFGHPFIDHACSRMRETSFLGLTAAVKMDMENPACSSEGVIFNFIVSFKGSRVSEHLIPVYVDLQTALEFDDSRTVADEFLKFRFKESNVAEHAPIPEQLWERLYTKALLWIELEIKTRLDEVQKNLDQQIGTTLPLINRHYDGIFAELEEILQLQKSKEKIYSIPAMKGLITRTENKIRRFKKLKETEMERMVKMKTIHTTYTLLSLALMKINGSL